MGRKCSCGKEVCSHCGGCINRECKRYMNFCLTEMKGLTLKERDSLRRYRKKETILRKIKEIKKERLSKVPKPKRKMGLDEALDKLPVLIGEVSNRWNIRVKDGCF